MNTPTPAPALTDEQVEAFTEDLAFIYEGEYDPQPRREAFDTWLVAVVAKAKREAAEEIAADLREWADAVIGETGMRSDGATLRWAADRIGTTR